VIEFGLGYASQKDFWVAKYASYARLEYSRGWEDQENGVELLDSETPEYQRGFEDSYAIGETISGHLNKGEEL